MDVGRHEWRLVAPPPVNTGEPELDAKQREVVGWDAGPAIVYAGPGTGKTTTLVESALARLADGVPAASILILTFGRDAAAELRQRLSLRIGSGEPPRVSTFHSFALELVVHLESEAPLLLSGAEQERAVRDVIDGTLAEETLRNRWPAELLDAVRTRGFSNEVRTAFAAARALGLGGDEIARIGERAGDVAWQSIGAVLDEYLDSQAQRNAIDYAELMFRATAALKTAAGAERVAHVQCVYVDEYQDTDVMQVAMLKELVRTARSLVVVGDPDQSIYAFRGADVTNVRDFTTDFADMARRHGMSQPETLVLSKTRRYGSVLRNYAREIFGDTGVPGLNAEQSLQHRLPEPAAIETSVRAFSYDDTVSEAAHIASEIRATAQETGDSWSDFAVLVRAAHSIPVLERALIRANIPVETDVRDTRLADQPAVRVLLRALEVVAGSELRISALHAHELLLSPLCGLDPTTIRSLARVLRADRDTSSDQVLADALMSTVPLFELAPNQPGAAELESLRRLLHDAHAKVTTGATPHEALWALWSGTNWPARLRKQAIEQASAFAHRDLDAICELFDNADRIVQRRHDDAGVSEFVIELRAQQVASESLARQGFRGPAVRLLTAHRAKGLEWKHVFVANITESVWPDMRRRSALLDVDRLTPDGLILPRSRQALFEEERRLFYVACTRAQRSLTVSGVAGLDKDAPQLSRFMSNRIVAPEVREGRPQRIDSTADLIAGLRRAATSEHSTPALRAAALQRLRSLASETDQYGASLFPEADWRTWWGACDVTDNERPVDPADQPLYVRGSSLDTLGKCSLRWMLEQKVHVQTPKNSALIFGSTLHALADAVVRGDLPADVDVLTAALQQAWTDAGYESKWQSERDFQEGIAAIGRFLVFHADRAGNPTRSEVDFDRVVEVRTPSGGVEQLLMKGSIDRIEIIDGNGVLVFDYKTGAKQAAGKDVLDNAQLRYYQHAVALGLLDDTLNEVGGSGEYEPAGGALVHLRVADGPKGKGSSHPKVQEQPSLTADPEWPVRVLGAGLEVVRNEAFVAAVGDHCDFCRMKPVCPLQPEGRQELT